MIGIADSPLRALSYFAGELPLLIVFFPFKNNPGADRLTQFARTLSTRFSLLFLSQRGRRNHQRLFRSQSSVSPSSRSPGEGREDAGTGRASGHSRRAGPGGGPAAGESGSLTPPHSRGSASSSSHSLRRSSFRETAKVVKRKLNNGTVIINKYRIVCELGRGSYGSVHLCRDGDTGIVSARFLGGHSRGRAVPLFF